MVRVARIGTYMSADDASLWQIKNEMRKVAWIVRV